MESIELIVKTIGFLFSPASLIIAGVVFILTFLIIISVYKKPKIRDFFQGSDVDFLRQKACDLEEAMEFININDLSHPDKKKITDSLESLKGPAENLLVKLV